MLLHAVSNLRLQHKLAIVLGTDCASAMQKSDFLFEKYLRRIGLKGVNIWNHCAGHRFNLCNNKKKVYMGKQIGFMRLASSGGKNEGFERFFSSSFFLSE